MLKDIKNINFLWKQYMYILTPIQKFWGVAIFFLSLIGSSMELISVSIMLPFIQALMDPKELLNNNVIKKALELFSFINKDNIVELLFCFIIVIFLVKNVYLIFLSWIRNKYSLKVNRELSISIINSYINRGYQFFRKNHTAVLMRGAVGSVVQTEGVWFSLFQLIAEFLTAFFILIYLAVTDMFITGVVVCIVLLCLVLVYFVSKQNMKKAGKEFFEKSALTNKRLLDFFYGIKEIFAANKESIFIDRYETAYIAQQRADVIKSLFMQSPNYIIEAFCVCGLVLTIALKMSDGSDMKEFIPKLAVFAMAAFRIMPSIGRISSYGNSIIYAAPSVNEVYRYIKESKESGFVFSNIEDIGDNEENYIFKDNLTIDSISFRYPDGEKDVLKDISIRIGKGESIGLVGESGAGKSTLADILLGLLDPYKGSVCMDGLNIREHKKMWANNVGYVPQDVYLMDDTIRRNVAFGDDDNFIDESRVIEVLKEAQLYEFATNLPNKLDTMIGERGVRFSGGQAQRIALARALYHNPEIIILDEATSALDNETEKAVMEAVNSMQGKKTMIIIAHRLTTIKNCDRIYEIKGGKAYERKYEELINE